MCFITNTKRKTTEPNIEDEGKTSKTFHTAVRGSVIDAYALCTTAALARLHTYCVPVSHKARRMRTQRDKREPFTGGNLVKNPFNRLCLEPLLNI